MRNILLKPESAGCAYILDIPIDGNVLTAIAELIPGTLMYRVWIAGVCDIIISQELPGQWDQEAGREVMDELLQAVGFRLEM